MANSPLLWAGTAAKFLKSVLQIPGSTSGILSVQPAAVTTSHTLTMPAANASGALTNDGSGGLSWTPASGAAFVGAFYYMSGNTTGSSSSPPVFNTMVYDTDSAFNGTIFTVPSGKGGYYEMTFFINPSGGANFHNIWKNGSAYTTLGYATPNGKITVPLSAGDTIGYRPESAGTTTFNGGPLYNNGNSCWVQFVKVG